MPWSAALGLLKPLEAILDRWRRIRVRVHVAYMTGDVQEKAFVNVVNLSKHDIEIVRVWFETAQPVDVLNPDRPLPRRLRPDESWETWCDLRSLRRRSVESLARVQLSSGKAVKSRPRAGAPPVGFIPGGSP